MFNSYVEHFYALEFIAKIVSVCVCVFPPLHIVHFKPCRSQWPRGLRRRSTAARLLRSWVRIHRRHGCLSVVSVVCCQVEFSATDWSLVLRSPTDCGASLCVIKKSRTRGGYSPARGLQNTNPQWVVAPVETNKHFKPYILKFSILHLCLGSKSYDISFVMHLPEDGQKCAETCSRHNIIIIYDIMKCL